MENSTKILVIDDLLKDNAPLIVYLKERYGDENIIRFKQSREGLDYVKDNLSQKMVIILDWEFGKGEMQGIDVFDEIRKETSLIYIIVNTAKAFSDIPSLDLKKLINNDAMAIIDKTDGYKKTLEFVDKAIHQLDSRLDSVLEQWVNRHSEDERIKPFIATRSGEVYNLNDLLSEIRQKTELGKDMEKKMIYLTIDLLARGKEKIND
ncbi:hypothetical protein GCM10027035_21980 [Emticicia sediminis]